MLQSSPLPAGVVSKKGAVGAGGKDPGQKFDMTIDSVDGVCDAGVLQTNVVETVGNVFNYHS